MANAAITIDLNAKIANFETELKRATGSLDRFEKKGSQVAAGFKTAMGSLAAVVSVGAVAAFAKSGIDAADALNDMSQRTGVAVKTLADYKLAATLADTSLDDLAKGIQRLTLSQSQAEQGVKTQAEALKRLGITARDPQKAFEQLADAVANSNDPIKTNAALNDVLGRSYVNLLPLLQGGAQGLRDSAAASASFSDAMVKLAPDAAKFNDQLDDLKLNAAGAAAQILTRLVPSLATTSERVGELLDEDKGIHALVRAFAGLGKLPFDLIFGDIQVASTAQQRIKELRGELADLQGDLKSAQPGGGKSSVVMRKIFGTPEEISQQITVIKNQIEALEKFGDKIYKPKVMSATAPEAGVINKPPASGSSKAKAIDKADIFNDEMARNAKLVADETDRIAGDLSFMAQVDLAQNNPIAAMGQEWVEAGRALKQDMMTPLEKFDGRLEYINELWRIGAIDIETYDRAMASAFDDAGAKIEQTNDMAREFGLTMQSAFEDAVIGGEDFRDILGGIGSDLQRMVLRKTITEPLGNAVSGFIDGIDFGSMFGFANGGVMTASGPLPLHAYASGGVASSPQLALFGEGRMNEAFVPLPDGRRIPVDMRGGGGGNVQVNIIESPGNGGKTERRQDGNGGNVLDIYVEQIKASIAGDISRGRGAVPDALAGTYGLNRVAGAY